MHYEEAGDKTRNKRTHNRWGSVIVADEEEYLTLGNTLAPPKIRPGRFRPPDKLLAMLKGQSLWGAKSRNPLDSAEAQHALSP